MKKLFICMALTAFVAGCSDKMPVVEMPNLDKSNPLLCEWDTPMQTPPFDKIQLSHYEPAFDAAIEVSRLEIDAIVNNPAKPTFKNTIVALEQQGALLTRITGIFYNLNECNTSEEMQKIAIAVQPKLTALANDVALNPQLFARVKAVYEKPNRSLSKEDKMLLEKAYKSFARNGAALNDADKALYRKYTTELGELTLKFGQNSLGATNAYTYNITDANVVAELPDFVKEGLAADAKMRGEKGWTVTLQAPSFGPFMKYSSNREIKEKLWMAYSSRAIGGEFDNTENIKRITELRLKIANLLGYKNHAAYELDERMAQDVPTVLSFLDELLTATKSAADAEYQTVNKYAQSTGLQGDIQPWDFAYYTDKYKNEKYALNDELVKPYLSLENVNKGIFGLANRLYGLSFKERKDVPVYHPEVTAYEVTDEKGRFMAMLYLDFFPRASKRAGAWMTTFRDQKIVNGVEQRPFVSLVMNFTKPTDTTPSLLTFGELTTYLHEFGHALHGMLAEGKYASLTGPNVYRDFVELPSQIMENWATEKEFLDMFAVHYQTGEAIPAELVKKIEASKNYLAAYSNVRQLTYALTDMAWHTLEAPYTGDVEQFERAAKAKTSVLPEIDGTMSSPTFTHVFAGGYSAGYYSYKWAEVLEADAFSLFKEKGVMNREVAESFRKNILSKGGTEHPMDLYVAFRGHKPEVKALIKKMGIEPTAAKK